MAGSTLLCCKGEHGVCYQQSLMGKAMKPLNCFFRRLKDWEGFFLMQVTLTYAAANLWLSRDEN